MRSLTRTPERVMAIILDFVADADGTRNCLACGVPRSEESSCARAFLG